MLKLYAYTPHAISTVNMHRIFSSLFYGTISPYPTVIIVTVEK